MGDTLGSLAYLDHSFGVNPIDLTVTFCIKNVRLDPSSIYQGHNVSSPSVEPRFMSF